MITGPEYQKSILSIILKDKDVTLFLKLDEQLFEPGPLRWVFLQIARHAAEYGNIPERADIEHSLSTIESEHVLTHTAVITSIYDAKYTKDAVLDTVTDWLKRTAFVKGYENAGAAYNSQDHEAAFKIMRETLDSVDVVRRGRAVKCSAVARKKVEWIWPGVLPAYAMTFIGGRAEQGKSRLCVDLACRFSAKTAWPDGREIDVPGKVLYVYSEDDLERQLVHLVDLNKGDQENFLFLRMPTMDQLAAEVAANPEVRLLVLDPLSALLGSECDTWRENQVRQALMPLERIMEKHHVSVIAIKHNRKNETEGTALSLLADSHAFGDLVRSAWICMQPREQGEFMLLQAKKSWSTATPGFVYEIHGVDTEYGNFGVINWTGERTPMTADDGLEMIRAAKKGGGKADECGIWLMDRLSGGVEVSKQVLVKEAYIQGGWSERTLTRCKQRLGIKHKDLSAPNGKGHAWFL